MRYLAILLLAPWLLILCWVYWTFPRNLPQTAGRRIFDFVALLLSVIATGASALFGFDMVALPAAGQLGRASGAIWQQVVPALYGYGAFIVVLVVAMLLRYACWGRRR